MHMFKIEGLNCMGCFRKIENSLKKGDAQILAQANVESKILTVQSSLPAEQISALINEAGYVAQFIVNDR